MGLSFAHGSIDWTDEIVWQLMNLSVREGLGVACEIHIDATQVFSTAPGTGDTCVLTLPTGEKFVLHVVSEPFVEKYGRGATDDNPIVVYKYDLIDFLSALDKMALPAVEFIGATSGSIITTLLASMDSAINVVNVAAGNTVSYLNTADFSKLSEIFNHQEFAEGNYIVQVLPTVNNGLAIKANYRENFGASVVVVDKDSDWEAGEFTPPKDQISPSKQIINRQRVKGNSGGGPHHTYSEFREFDALQSSFRLGAIPYGIEGNVLLDFQSDGGLVTGQDTSSLPKIVPLHYPLVVEVSDISMLGTGEICGFKNQAGTVLLSTIINASSIGAKVNGTSFTQATPFFSGGAPPDINHQYYYDMVAHYTQAGLEVRIIENYLDNTAGETVLATITAIADNVLTVTMAAGLTVANLPESIRIFAAGDPNDIRGFANIIERNVGASTIKVDPIFTDWITTDKIANGDSASVTTTEVTVYNSSVPADIYGKPQLIISGGTGVRFRGWTASFAPSIEMKLLDNPYTGLTGRRLRVDTINSKNVDVVVARSGNSAIATFVGDRLPLRGDIRLAINYDVSKQADVTLNNSASQAEFGICPGEIIESEFAVTEAEATAIAQAVLDEYAFPKAEGTITRESLFVSSFPMPAQTVAIDVPLAYRLAIQTVPISEVSVGFKGSTFLAVGQPQVGVLGYAITIGKLELQEIVERQLFNQQVRTGNPFRPLLASGPRITNGTWNDTNSVVLTLTGGGVITLAGKAASASFNPADYAIGNLREAPVQLEGTITQGGKVHGLLVEVIYPPLGIDVASVRCTYNPKRNEVMYRWNRPPGALSYKIQRLVDEDENPATAAVWRITDEIETAQYPASYEPDSKQIRVLVTGLADKLASNGWQEITCVLAPIPAPTVFQVKKANSKGKFVFLVSAPPTGQFAGRAEFGRLLLRRSNTSTTYSMRGDFPADNDDVLTIDTPLNEKTTASRYRTTYDDYQPGERVWATFCWVDRFHDEGAIFAPFDAAHPPVSVGSLNIANFFQSATQANGGAVEDDNDATGQVEHSGRYRVGLGRHNDHVIIEFDESDPTADGSIGNVWDNEILDSVKFDINDDDVINGYVDVPMKQEFRKSRKKQRTYRPRRVRFIGPWTRELADGGGILNEVREKRYLVGYDSDVESAPALVPHKVDAVYNKKTFEFQPGIVPTHNFTTVGTPTIGQKQDGFKVKIPRPDDAGIRRFILLIHTAVFGTKGPGTDANIATDLEAITSESNLLVYEATNTTRNVTVKAVDIGDVSAFRIHNGDDFNGLTITEGTTYFVSVIAQKKSGRYSTAFSVVVNTTSGEPAGGAEIPGSFIFPSSLSLNTVDGDPDKNLARFAVIVTTTNGQTLALNNIRAIGVYIVERNQANTADIAGGQLFFSRTSLAGIFDSTQAQVSGFLKMGRRYRITGVTAVNGDKETLTSGVFDFVGGGLLFVDSADSLTVPAPTFGAIARVDGSNKLDRVPVSLAQDGTNIVWFKRLVLEASINGGAWDVEHDVGLKSNDTIHASASAAVTYNFTVKRKAGKTAQYRATAYAVGGKASATTSSSSQTATADDQQQDTAASGAVTNLDMKWSVKKGLKATCDEPAVHPNALRGFKFTFMNNAENRFMIPETGASTSTKSVATRLKKDSHYTTNLKKTDLHSDFSAGVKVEVIVVTLVNGVETDGTAVKFPASGVLTIGNEVVNSMDAVNVVSVGVSMVNSGQEIDNGDFLYATSVGGTTVDDWKRRTSPFTSDNPITTVTTDITWDQALHAGIWKSNAARLYANLKKRFVPGTYFAVVFQAKTDGSFGSDPVVTLRIRKGDDTDATETAQPITLLGVSSTYQMYGAIIRIATGSDPSSSNFISFETATTLSSTNNIIIDKVMVVRGKQPAAFSPRAIKEQGPGSTLGVSDENYDITPASSGEIDLGNPSGSPGGWPGTGVRFDPNQQ